MKYEKYVVIANWNSCDSMVYGLFDSIEEANEFRDNYKWSDYDSRHELYLEIEEIMWVTK
tara:strand:+ start:732 stop:911 length:180 start_codon:yes stop_codon:yes gene_type:complete